MPGQKSSTPFQHLYIGIVMERRHQPVSFRGCPFHWHNFIHLQLHCWLFMLRAGWVPIHYARYFHELSRVSLSQSDAMQGVKCSEVYRRDSR